MVPGLTLLLTHWGQVTHICIIKITIIGSDNGLLPGQHQAIIWTNNGIMLIGSLGTNFSEILIEIYAFLFKKMHFFIQENAFKNVIGKWRPFCLRLNVLIINYLTHSQRWKVFASSFKLWKTMIMCLPFLFSTCSLAPWAIRNWTRSGRELSMALISGVAPLMVVASRYALWSSKYSTTSFRPAWHAKCNGVHLKLSWAFTWALKIHHIMLWKHFPH